MESSARKHGSEKGSNSRNGEEMKLVDRKRAHAGKVEGVYNGKDKEMFTEGKQSVRKEGLSKVVRKLMGTGVNLENECEDQEELVVGELGRRMVAEEWSMGEEAMAKVWRVTRQESMTFVWGSKNSIALELSQIQPISLYLDSGKCNINENTKAACVRTLYNCDAQNEMPVPFSYQSTPDARLDLRGRVIARAVPVLGLWEECSIPKFLYRVSGGWLTPERLRKLRIGNISRPQENEGLLGMLSNREYALSWTWEELGTISDKLEPPHRIRLETSHNGLERSRIPYTEES